MKISGHTNPLVIGLIGGTVVLFGIFCALVLYICYSRKVRKTVRISNQQPLYTQFSFSEIETATNNFDEALVIGEGGFGKVYLGKLKDGTVVAIKRGTGLHNQGEKEFRSEIEMLSKLCHRHLIPLLGYCEENSEMIIVYPYMANGTLRHRVSIHPRLTWIQRLMIVNEAASGLHYLHTGAERPIIHRDVKSSNILLDEHLSAKVADFGLSKQLPTLDDNDFSDPKGSFGYLDPEYYRTQRFTEKSDVYSLGVVLFEVLCGRPALDKNLPYDKVSLAGWAVHCCQNNILHEIIDPCIAAEISPACLKIYVETAVNCLASEGKDRPSMGDVFASLERALKLQESNSVLLDMPLDSFVEQ